MNQTTLLVLVGPPGSGKGSVSQLCQNRLGMDQISTGALCRMYSKSECQLGRTIDLMIKSGKLISDELIVSMVTESLEKKANTGSYVILDGFPRTVAQARSLIDFIADKNQFQIKLVRFSLSDDAIIDRLTNRLICSQKGCQRVYSIKTDSGLEARTSMVCDACNAYLEKREDDAVDTIKNRLSIYHKHEKALLDFMKNHVPVHELVVDKSIESVFKDFTHSVGIALNDSY